jgi:signal transduction histidine kinase/CheY-like chemotaxis protein/ABC-type amino acid transport substrate-binding protein
MGMPARRRLSAALIALILMICIAAPARAGGTKTVKVGFFAMEGYHMMDDAGNRSGYGYDYLQAMAQYNNWVYDYVGYDKSWSDMLTMLDNGEIDMVTSAQKTPERETKYDFSSQPIGTSSLILCVKEGDTRYSTGNIAGFDGMRVGMIQGNSRNDAFAQYAQDQGFSYTPVYFEDFTDMTAALDEGRDIDAVVSSNLRAISGEWIIAELDQRPYYVIVKKGNTALLAEINAAIEAVNRSDPGLANSLFQKYYSAAAEVTQTNLTQSQREYITGLQDSGTTLSAVIADGGLPLVDTTDSGLGGIVRETAQKISEYSGLPLAIGRSSAKEWGKTTTGRDADLVLNVPQDYNLAERNGFKLSDPYLETGCAKVHRREDDTDATVAVTTLSGVTGDYIRGHYTEDAIRRYDSYSRCVQAVKDGDADTLITDTLTASATVGGTNSNVLESSEIAGLSEKLTIAVRDTEDTRLMGILNSTISLLKNGALNTIINEATLYNTADQSVQGFIFAHPALSIGIAVVLCAAIAVAIYAMVKAKHDKLDAQQSRDKARYLSYICASNDEVAEYDLQNHTRVIFDNDGDQIRSRVIPVDHFYRDPDKVHPDDLAAMDADFSDEALLALSENSGHIYREIRLKDDKGDYRWYSLSLQGIARDDQHPANFMLFKKDIDDAKKADESQRQILRDALAQAQSASSAKGAFLSRMSHEMRTPLNAIIGYLSLMQTAMDDPERAAGYIAKSRLASRNLLQIINDVLDMSAIENGKMVIAEEPFDLRENIQSVTEMFFTQSEEKGIHFETNLRDVTEEYCVGDSLRLNQILMNLLSNAVKFTPAGGSITLEVVQVMVTADMVHFRFTVADTGKGMSAEFMDRLFSPFVQENAAIAKNFGGSGLGLSITRNLCTLMDGTIDVESTPGKGTTFTVTLPFKRDLSRAALPACDKDAQRDFSKLRALVVDDDEEATDYVGLLLERCGIRHEKALSGEDALKVIRSAKDAGDPFSLCIMDLKMPGMNGIETTRAIRTQIDSTLPVVIVTAYDFQGFEAEGKAAGVNHFVSKPLFQSSIFDLLVSTFGKYEPEGDVVKTVDFKGRRLLLAEDNEMNQEIAQMMLEAVGFEVETAKDGAEAVKAFEDSAPGHFDAILMDIMMPEMDGHEATRTIRRLSRPDAKTIPIIAMTANAFTEDVTAALAAGMNAHVAKPIKKDQLFGVLGEIFSQIDAEK